MAKVSRDKVIGLFQAIDYKTAHLKTNEWLAERIKKFPEIADEEVEEKADAAGYGNLLRALVKAARAGTIPDIVGDLESQKTQSEENSEETQTQTQTEEKDDTMATKTKKTGKTKSEKVEKTEKVKKEPKEPKAPPVESDNGNGTNANEAGHPGVIDLIKDILRSATKESPVTKKQIHEELCRKFPERAKEAEESGRKGMWITVNAQVPNRLNKKGWDVKSIKLEDSRECAYYLGSKSKSKKS